LYPDRLAAAGHGGQPQSVSGIVPGSLVRAYRCSQLPVDDALRLPDGPAGEQCICLAGCIHPAAAVVQSVVAGGEIDFEDAHYWLDPDKVGDFYRVVAAALSQRFPQHRAQIDVRLANSLSRLEQGVAEVRALLAPVISRKVIVDHQAYSHLQPFLGIEILGALTDERGAALGARGFSRLMGQTKVDCIVVEQLPPVRGAVKLAKHYGRPIVEIDPLGRGVSVEEGYAGLLRAFGRGFQRCFVSD